MAWLIKSIEEKNLWKLSHEMKIYLRPSPRNQSQKKSVTANKAEGKYQIRKRH